jgi:hypothetical protein
VPTWPASIDQKLDVDPLRIHVAEEGTKPQKTRLGKRTIRVDEDLQRRLAVATESLAKTFCSLERSVSKCQLQ